MDGDYHQNEDEEKFEQSLFVHTTVIFELNNALFFVRGLGCQLVACHLKYCAFGLYAR